MQINCIVNPQGLNIKIEDDGEGVDPEKLTSPAMRKGMLTSAEARALAREQKLQIVFRTGFSTKSVVSDLSGRGVGLDSASTFAKKLVAEIRVESVLVQNTRFEFRLKDPKNF